MISLCYCTNIFPGESYKDLIANLEKHVAPTLKRTADLFGKDKEQIAPLACLGLRISNLASREMMSGFTELKAFCEKHSCYIASINGFPYGTFHDADIKEKVYQPDWRERERVDYTKRLIELSAKLQAQINHPLQKKGLAQRACGIAISTSPIAFKEGFERQPPSVIIERGAKSKDWSTSISHLREVIAHCLTINGETHTKTSIALEPEPACVIETLHETEQLFEALALNNTEHEVFGLCLDCCHQAVQFESAADWLELFASGRASLKKLQVSSAISVNRQGIASLKDFDEPTYLHQCVIQSGSELIRISDLDQLGSASHNDDDIDEVRCHFHVPVFADCIEAPSGQLLGTTQNFLTELLQKLATQPYLCLEVETYTFAVLPQSVSLPTLPENIERELRWTARALKSD